MMAQRDVRIENRRIRRLFHLSRESSVQFAQMHVATGIRENEGMIAMVGSETLHMIERDVKRRFIGKSTITDFAHFDDHRIRDAREIADEAQRDMKEIPWALPIIQLEINTQLVLHSHDEVGGRLIGKYREKQSASSDERLAFGIRTRISLQVAHGVIPDWESRRDQATGQRRIRDVT